MSHRLLLIALFFIRCVPAFASDIIGTPKVGPVSESSVVISWQTDVETGTRLSYGLAPDQLTERAAGGVTASHELTLTGLQPGARYFFTVGTARKRLATGEFTMSGHVTTTASPLSSLPGSSAAATPRLKSVLAKIFAPKQDAPPARATWGNPASLPDHFARHGADFHANDAEEYARMAWQFGQQSKQGGLLVKMDRDGTRRVFDPKTGAFAAYNANGATKTYFKTHSRDYFARQPGRLVSTPAP